MLEPIVETVLAQVTFDPWSAEDDWNRAARSVQIEFLDRKWGDSWLDRQYRATIRDAANQIVVQVVAEKPEGFPVRLAVDRLCHQLGQWWATPDCGAYSVDWLCGYMAGQRSRA